MIPKALRGHRNEQDQQDGYDIGVADEPAVV
jgi:hypothetical protein